MRNKMLWNYYTSLGRPVDHLLVAREVSGYRFSSRGRNCSSKWERVWSAGETSLVEKHSDIAVRISTLCRDLCWQVLARPLWIFYLILLLHTFGGFEFGLQKTRENVNKCRENLSLLHIRSNNEISCNRENPLVLLNLVGRRVIEMIGQNSERPEWK